MSVDGRYVAFRSVASDLVAGDTNGVQDAFVFDRQTDTITRVSVDPTGTQLTTSSVPCSFTNDARYVGICGPGRDLVYDRQTGTSTLVDPTRNTDLWETQSWGAAISQ